MIRCRILTPQTKDDPLMPKFRSCLFAALLAALPFTTMAQVPSNPNADEILLAAGFYDGHPDLKHRNDGLVAYGENDFANAMQSFKRAAYYADKPSQAMIGELYWSGRGVPQDRAMGLVWMDLAAERDYQFFSAKRNYYWNTLSVEERRRALALAKPIFDEYADDVAEPRIARVLRRHRNNATGSRVGSMTSQVQIVVPGHGTIDATRFYDPKYWDPSQYRSWQDSFWKEIPRGIVTVGTPEKADAAETPASAPEDDTP